MIDFDKERHAVQQMQNNPNRNEAKFIKVKEQMENAKRTYEVLNSELHDELPALHDSRILFLVTNMQTLFAAEEVFHSETAKVGGHNKERRGMLPLNTYFLWLKDQARITQKENSMLCYDQVSTIFLFFS